MPVQLPLLAPLETNVKLDASSSLREDEAEMIGDIGWGDSKLSGGRSGGPERLEAVE